MKASCYGNWGSVRVRQTTPNQSSQPIAMCYLLNSSKTQQDHLPPHSPLGLKPILTNPCHHSSSSRLDQPLPPVTKAPPLPELALCCSNLSLEVRLCVHWVTPSPSHIVCQWGWSLIKVFSPTFLAHLWWTTMLDLLTFSICITSSPPPAFLRNLCHLQRHMLLHLWHKS